MNEARVRKYWTRFKIQCWAYNRTKQKSYLTVNDIFLQLLLGAAVLGFALLLFLWDGSRTLVALLVLAGLGYMSYTIEIAYANQTGRRKTKLKAAHRKLVGVAQLCLQQFDTQGVLQVGEVLPLGRQIILEFKDSKRPVALQGCILRLSGSKTCHLLVTSADPSRMPAAAKCLMQDYPQLYQHAKFGT